MPDKPKPSKSTPAPVVQTKRDEIEVCVEAQHMVTQVLKSPSTAKFPTCRDTTIREVSTDHYQVSAYVDSQNGFGAMVRSNWAVEYHYTNGGKNVQLDYMSLGGKVIYDGGSGN